MGSYPYHPDVLAYSTTIARELGDPSAHAPALHPDAPLELPYGVLSPQGMVQLQAEVQKKNQTMDDRNL